MFRSPLLVFLLVVALGASCFRIYQLSRQVDSLSSTNQDLEARYENLQTELLRAHVRQQTAQLGQRSVIEQLQARIEAQKGVVAQARQRLERERASGLEGPAGKHLGGLREKLHEEGQLIADLNEQLKDVHDRQAQLRNQDKFYQQQSSASQRQNDEDLKTQITRQQEELRQLENQLRQLKVNPWDSDSTDQYNALQAKVNARKTSLQQLQQERVSNSQQWRYQTAQTHAQNQQKLSDLHRSEQEIQAQLQREKSAQASLQHDIQSGVQTQRSENAVLESAQADLENQKAKLQDLQSQLEAAREQLEQIQPSSAAGAAGATGAAGAAGGGGVSGQAAGSGADSSSGQ